MYNTTEDGWLIYNDTQYLINSDNLNMEAARAFCKKNFGELVVITGESERKFLWKQARNSFFYFFKTMFNIKFNVCSQKTDPM